MRLTPDEREILRQVTEVLAEGDLAEFVRRSTLTVARNILQLARGEIEISHAMASVSTLFYQFVGWQKLSEMHASGKLPAGEYHIRFEITNKNGEVIQLDEETREIGETR